MTSPTEYRQRKNTASRKHGGHFICPNSGHVLEHNVEATEALDTYQCQPCGYRWDNNGEPIKEKS